MSADTSATDHGLGRVPRVTHLIRRVRVWPHRRHYTAMGILFHWTMAGLIGLQLWLGWRTTWLPAGYDKADAYAFHSHIGLTILVLAGLRFAWRTVVPRPANTEDLPGWQHQAARITHWGLYALMFALPLTGWLMLSATAQAMPIVVFGLVPWPHMPFFEEMTLIERAFWEMIGERAHEFLVWSLLALLALHIGAALQHQFINRDEVMSRMIPWLYEKRRQQPLREPRRGDPPGW
jgi:cytochrome b561